MGRDKISKKPVLRGLRLANFRGFPSTGADIPLRPLTLIFGPNSGGKSSVLKGFSGIAQTKVKNGSTGENSDWVSEGPW
ncbi:uncharacterized protein METZ01_LOCUS494590, partial [marine metagenome]